MRLLFCCLILVFSSCSPCLAQFIDAINEDSTRRVQFRLNRGVECEVDVAGKPVIVHGKLASIDSTNFQLKLSDGYYTTVLIDQLIRMRYHRYTRQRLAGAGSGLLSGSGLHGSSTSLIPLVAVSALTGLGIAALTSERASFRHKDPSIYQGWIFRASLQE